jgi:excinuclease UvrABC nuclease subunit
VRKRPCVRIGITKVKTMTEQEIQTEKKYRYAERLGILCGTNDPTPEQIEEAMKDADEYEKTARAACATPAEP